MEVLEHIAFGIQLAYHLLGFSIGIGYDRGGPLLRINIGGRPDDPSADVTVPTYPPHHGSD